jgi:hypothetical protein
MQARWYRVAAAATLVAGLAVPVLADDDHGRGGGGKNMNFNVAPRVYDPSSTRLVSSEWEMGTGCPTSATVRLFDSNPPYELQPASKYTDPACATADPFDRNDEGLVLVKTGPTLNNAAAVADLKGVKGAEVTELGYDIRKPGTSITDPRGSHCGAGAPRFDIVVNGNDHFLACGSPVPTSDQPGIGWQRLRWGGSDPNVPLLAYPASGTCESPTVPGDGGTCDLRGVAVDAISIVFDEGQDAMGGPDQFGVAFLDNIDVNGKLVGRGPEGESHGPHNDKGNGKGH